MLSDHLTIRVESTTEFVDVQDFVSIVNNTVELLDHVANTMLDEGQHRVRWRVADVSLNSPLSITIFPDTDNLRAGEAISATTQGLRHLEENATGRPRYFSNEALEAAKKLVNPLGNGVSRLAFISDVDVPFSPTQRVAAHASELLPKPHYEIGTIEGSLESISVHRQRMFAIWDVFTNARVECRFSDELYEAAHNGLRHRVAVTGKIYYNSQGHPVSIAVSEIRRLREKEALPQFSDLEKLSLRCDGDPAEVLRRLWDGD